MPENLAVVILTFNEEQNLPGCLESLRVLNSQVYVVDSGSVDTTIEIATTFGATVVTHAWCGYAAQMNWALENIPTSFEWIMRVDADERLTEELATEIEGALPQLPSTTTGVLIKRRTYFLGKWMRYGGLYPTWLLRIWRCGFAHCEQRALDEHIVLESGDMREFMHDLIDDNRKGLSHWINKHNAYADLEINDIHASPQSDSHQHLHASAARRRFLKEKLYWRSPLLIRAVLYWFFRYVLLLGFLDGRVGFVYHFLHAFWYRVLVDAKLIERESIRS